MGMGTLKNLTLTNLNNCFAYAKEEDAKYIAIVVEAYGRKEVIINEKENFDFKQSYWNAAYNEELIQKANPEIKIIAFSQADSYDEIQALLGV